MKELTAMSRMQVINYLINDGFNEKALRELTDIELKRIFILCLALNSKLLTY